MVRRGWERRNNDVPGNIDEIHVRLSEVWGNCDDIHFRWIRIGAQRAFVVWIYTLIGKELVQKGLLEPLTSWNKPEVFFSDLEQVLQTVSVKILKTMDEVNTAIGNGLAVLCIDGFDQAAAMDVTHFQRRAVKRPSLELSVQGPQEAFTESLETNLGLIRRRLKSPRVKVEYVVLGRVSKTRVALVYIDGIVKSRLVQECRVRLRRIDVDSILDSGHIEELIDDAPISLFPTIDNTERPDRLAAEILQGRVGIIVEGSPNVLLVPAIFAHFLQSSEDYFERYFMATAIRILRHFLFWIALLLPATYIALLSYHQEMIPTNLLITLVADHEGVPFPVVLEAFMMGITFEAVWEAGVRLPKAAAQSVSIVGTLVLGEATVKAGIVSTAMVIIVGFTGIAAFSLPSYNMTNTLRILRFPMMVVAGMFGLYGMIIAMLILWIHLVSLRSFGVPYMSPLAPLVWPDVQDVFTRPSWRQMRRRPKTMEPADSTRNAGVPGPLPAQTKRDPR